MLPETGSYVYIQSYKHDGSLHRTWCRGFVLEANEDRIVAVTDKTWVIEADGRRWLTREPAVCFFYTHLWFNIISMIRMSGIYYYCNLASPSLYDGKQSRILITTWMSNCIRTAVIRSLTKMNTVNMRNRWSILTKSDISLKNRWVI